MKKIANIADSMEDWVYTFDPVSKEKWIAQIEKDLREKPLDSLLGEWWPGETLQPLIHQEDAKKEVVRLPDALFKTPPRITEFIPVGQQSPSAVNTQILEALKFGAETIILQTETLSENPLEDWLKGVHLEMINVQLEPIDSNIINISTLGKFIEKGVAVRIPCNYQPHDGFTKSLANLTENGIDSKALRFIYNFPSSGLWNEEVIKTFNQLSNDFVQWKSSGKAPHEFFKQTILTLEADLSYFKHIIQTRVLHLLWHNLMTYYAIEPTSGINSYLECHIRDIGNKSPDQYLIQASMSSLATSLVGTQALCIHNLEEGAIQDFYKRTNRNIHHLLHLESNMYQGTDPLAGAYAIDYYTIIWTRKIWEGLILED